MFGKNGYVCTFFLVPRLVSARPAPSAKFRQKHTRRGTRRHSYAAPSRSYEQGTLVPVWSSSPDGHERRFGRERASRTLLLDARRSRRAACPTSASPPLPGSLLRGRPDGCPVGRSRHGVLTANAKIPKSEIPSSPLLVLAKACVAYYHVQTLESRADIAF